MQMPNFSPIDTKRITVRLGRYIFQESPEKIREADNMNKSFRIDFEDDDQQQEDLICSSCLSKHCDMEQPLCLFCGWKVLE
jgi:hypothetical protein